ncbi:recombinase zinc ribbon domain-containing protein [Aliiroseovarius halocynthiae]|uniref:zinc ribbon domain-containing protein n=1 Tax=Aliiroseovarius halocynthiae TaxID=985055 RepID=UPI00163D52EC|nr:zinc ribbon domain-containing protein [Aliiroseovarius halocynthiae]
MIRKDFPLRGFATCGDCGSNLRSSWSKGKTKYYPYYLCQSKGCDSYGKSIPRDKIEGAFADVVKTLEPSPNTWCGLKPCSDVHGMRDWLKPKILRV